MDVVGVDFRQRIHQLLFHQLLFRQLLFHQLMFLQRIRQLPQWPIDVVAEGVIVLQQQLLPQALILIPKMRVKRIGANGWTGSFSAKMRDS